MLEEDTTRKDYYISKLRLFANFTEDDEVSAFADAIEVHYLNSFAHDYHAALALIDENLEKYPEDKIFMFTLEKSTGITKTRHMEWRVFSFT